MANLCIRCRFRLHHLPSSSTRAFTTSQQRTSKTKSFRAGIPSFTATSQPELDDILASFRNKHFIPTALNKHERKLIFGTKNKEYLAAYPQTVEVGNEEIPLEWIDQRTEIPPRRKSFVRAVNLMSEGGEKSDWNQLPALLTGLNKMKKCPRDSQLAKIVRLASADGRFGLVVQCLHQSRSTALTLKKEQVLEAVIAALRELGASDEWTNKEKLQKALRDGNEISMRLEDEDHGTGKVLGPNDPRRRPEVLSVFLELVAVYSWQFQEGKDSDGKVRAFADRLLSNIEGAESPTTTEPATTGPQHEILRGVSIWHGLQLAEKILGDNMPNHDLARRVISNWEAGLSTLTQKLEQDEDKTTPGSYGWAALVAWRNCIVPGKTE